MKKIIFLGVFVLLFGFLTACTQKETAPTNNDSVSSLANLTLPEEKADITGLVKSVNGNEVKIMVIETQNEKAVEENANTEKSNVPVAALGASTQIGPGGGPGGNSGEMDESQRIEMMKQRSTGEVTVTIPVGISMTNSVKNETDGSGRTIEEAGFSDISADKMVNIWLNKDVLDRKIAEFVNIVNF